MITIHRKIVNHHKLFNVFGSPNELTNMLYVSRKNIKALFHDAILALVVLVLATIV